ncbi:MAG TPA: MarR family transcriptional regulator, partial [Acholeplasmatales bacterium]|nr:MarR family transcriptional regulator [Acholeplasmatales bacterium]
MSKSRALINELLVDVFNNILGIEEDVIKTRGVKLSVKEVHILEAVRNSREPTMSAIAKRLRITTGTLTASIDRLVAKKFVIRANDETD